MNAADREILGKLKKIAEETAKLEQKSPGGKHMLYAAFVVFQEQKNNGQRTRGTAYRRITAFLERHAMDEEKVRKLQKADSYLEDEVPDWDAVDTVESFIETLDIILEDAQKRRNGRQAEILSRMNDLRERLLDKVIGQEEAVTSFVDGVASSLMGIRNKDKNRPLGIFLFAGPPGVGKTYLSELGAELLEIPCKRIDMSEYSTHESVNGLIGFERTYKASVPGVLTSFVSNCNWKKKACMLIFDEVEKAHFTVIQIFLQILDAGRLTDKYTEETVSFAHSFIVFTTNAGRSLYEDGRQQPYAEKKSVILDAIREDRNPDGRPFFPEAILSRFGTGYPLMFRNLETTDLVQIAYKEMQTCGKRLYQKYGQQIRIDREIALLLLLREGGECDARNIRAEAERFIEKNYMDCWTKLKDQEAVQKVGTIEFVVDEKDRSWEGKPETGGMPEKLLFLGEPDAELAAGLDALFENTGLEERFELKSLTGDGSFLEQLKNERNIAVIFLMCPRDSGKTGIYSRDVVKTEAFRKFNSNARDVLREYPSVPLYAVYDRNGYRETLIEEGLKSLGIAEAIGYDQEKPEEFQNTMMRLLESRRLNVLAHKFARENRQLAFDIVPSIQKGRLILQLRNFDSHQNISGADRGDVIMEDRMPQISFADILGNEDVKTEMQEFIAFMQNPHIYPKDRQPKGILLYGPPGTGKTHFAKAFAHEAGVAFFAKTGNELMRPGAIKELFRKARSYAPATIFIDEVEVIAMSRESHRGMPEILNQLLTELDGFGVDPNRPVFFIAATNAHVDEGVLGEDEAGGSNELDSAFLNRFDRRIQIYYPKKEERISFLKKELIRETENIRYMRGIAVKAEAVSEEEALTEEVLGYMAKKMSGKSYRDLKYLVELSSRNAKKGGHTAITREDLENALKEMRSGDHNVPNVTFDDIIGHENAKKELKEFVRFLDNPGSYKDRQPKGVLLYGPPGTGKTYFAKAFANEAGVPFFAMNASQFLNMYIGAGSRNIRKLFAKARACAPAMIFIDEIDVIAGERMGSGNANATLNQLLSEMDGFSVDADRPVFLIAATNFGIDRTHSYQEQVLDKAFVDRFDRKIEIKNPTKEDRLEYLKKSGEFTEAQLLILVKKTQGMSYREMKGVLDAADRKAKDENRGVVTIEILDDAIEEIRFGEKRDRGEEECERTAWHEAGHAYIHWKYGETPEYITIVSRGFFGGYVKHKSTENKSGYTKTEIRNNVKAGLAGRAAERIRYGESEGLSTGPSNDFQQAGWQLWNYVCTYGMDTEIAFVPGAELGDAMFSLEDKQKRVETLLNDLMREVYEELLEDREILEQFAKEVLKKQILFQDDIDDFLGKAWEKAGKPKRNNEHKGK